MNTRKIIFVNRGERYEEMIDHRSNIHLRSFEIKPEKNSGCNT